MNSNNRQFCFALKLSRSIAPSLKVSHPNLFFLAPCVLGKSIPAGCAPLIQFRRVCISSKGGRTDEICFTLRNPKQKKDWKNVSATTSSSSFMTMSFFFLLRNEAELVFVKCYVSSYFTCTYTEGYPVSWLTLFVTDIICVYFCFMLVSLDVSTLLLHFNTVKTCIS